MQGRGRLRSCAQRTYDRRAKPGFAHRTRTYTYNSGSVRKPSYRAASFVSQAVAARAYTFGTAAPAADGLLASPSPADVTTGRTTKQLDFRPDALKSAERQRPICSASADSGAIFGGSGRALAIGELESTSAVTFKVPAAQQARTAPAAGRACDLSASYNIITGAPSHTSNEFQMSATKDFRKHGPILPP